MDMCLYYVNDWETEQTPGDPQGLVNICEISESGERIKSNYILLFGEFDELPGTELIGEDLDYINKSLDEMFQKCHKSLEHYETTGRNFISCIDVYEGFLDAY